MTYMRQRDECLLMTTASKLLQLDMMYAVIKIYNIYVSYSKTVDRCSRSTSVFEFEDGSKLQLHHGELKEI